MPELPHRTPEVEVEEELAFGQRSWNLPTLRLTLTLQQE